MLRFTRLSRCAQSLCFRHRGVGCIPHPEKAHRGGEDAFASSAVAIGVADGVGGYTSSGVNPAFFARQLMRVSLKAAETKPHQLTAMDAIEVGFQDVRKMDGGCPAVFATFAAPRVASLWSLGDCQILMSRGGAMMYQSTSQQHYFNCPYQLPGDEPKRGLQARFDVEVGDVFLLASDGVFDNIDTNDLLEVMKKAAADPVECDALAKALAQKAITCGGDTTYVSPFARAARQEGYKYVGGKLDDVTLVLAVVGAEGGAVGDGAKPSVRLIDELFPIKS